MRVALVHDYLKEVGGAEKVLMALKEMWPEAPVYTAYKFPEYWGYNKDVLGKWEIKESWGRYLPFLPKLISHYTIISPLFFSVMDLSEFDVVIVSATGGYFPNGVKIGPKTTLITYCHTPPRFLYGYPTATSERYKWYWRPISEIANHLLRIGDFRWAQRPSIFIANSKNVARRIAKFYRRDAQVVYPPIQLDDDRDSVKKVKRKDYYVIVSRIVGSKNIEIAIEAAKKHGFKLKIAGRAIGRSGNEVIAAIKGKNVEYLGEVSEGKKIELFREGRGFLALESEADFGMTTVEPQAYGMPVVAFRGGGYLESLVENKTGVFFDGLSPESLWEVIQRFEKTKWHEESIRTFAKSFSKERFKKEMLKVVNTYAGITRD